MRAFRRDELFSPLPEPKRHQKLRLKAWALFRECEAIYFLTNSIAPELVPLLEQEEMLIDQLPRAQQLLGYIADKAAELHKWRRRLNVNATFAELEQIFSQAEQLPDGKSLLFPEHYAVKYFPGYDYGLPFFDLLPLHANLMLSWSGAVEWSLLEAKVYEDMASLSNLAERTLASAGTAPEQRKQAAALFRAAGLTAVIFVEAFLNGVAADYYLEHFQVVDDSTKGLLLDWDFVRDRPKFLSVKDKFLRYQRVILGVEHAPVQESNCPELAYFITAARNFRDAIVHPAPDILDHVPLSKQNLLFTHTPEQARKAISSAIQLVHRLTSVLYGNQDRLFWLIEPGEDGYFSSDAFF